MFLNFLIIHFSWVSFALSAILCASASSPAAEPGAQLECGMHPTSGHSSLHTPQATYCITFAPLQLWYFAAIINVLSQLLLKHTSANKETASEQSSPGF